jgi:hypothetical protein
MNVTERLVSTIAKVSPSAAAAIDWVQPRSHTSWGGPLNGQIGRRRMVICLSEVVRPDFIVETGTYRGETTGFLANLIDGPVFTVEANERYGRFARWRLSGRRNVRLASGDSRDFLRKLAGRRGGQRALFYLDAHWASDLPLAEELEIIAEAWPSAAVLIDDFQVPDDPGYAFDDYGPGRRLTQEILPRIVADWHRLYPVTTSDDETGARRGSVVLASPTFELHTLLRCGLRLGGDRRAAVEERSWLDGARPHGA